MSTRRLSVSSFRELPELESISNIASNSCYFGAYCLPPTYTPKSEVSNFAVDKTKYVFFFEDYLSSYFKQVALYKTIIGMNDVPLRHDTIHIGLHGLKLPRNQVHYMGPSMGMEITWVSDLCWSPPAWQSSEVSTVTNSEDYLVEPSKCPDATTDCYPLLIFLSRHLNLSKNSTLFTDKHCKHVQNSDLAQIFKYVFV